MEIENSLSNLLSELAYVPLRITQLAGEMNEATLQHVFAEGEWSVSEVFAHIRASDEILVSRVYAILTRDRPPLVAYDERRWAEVCMYGQSDFHSSLILFALRRAELVKILHHVPLDSWKRIGIHEAHGQISLLDVVTGLVEHEKEHCAQLEAHCARLKEPPSGTSIPHGP